MSTIVVTPPAAAARVAVVEALPLGATGLVDVHMGVDQPGQQHLVVGEVHGPSGGGDSSYAVTATIRPSATATHTARSAPSTTARRARMTARPAGQLPR